jgi:hypothetical protein
VRRRQIVIETPSPPAAAVDPVDCARVRRRLYRHARAQEILFDHVLRRYAGERLVHRLTAASPGTLVVRGAWAIEARLGVPHRLWRTLQLWDLREREEAPIAALVRASCKLGDDGLSFDGRSVRIEAFHPERPYGWLRVKLFAYLDKAQIPLQLELGRAASLVPEPSTLDLAPLLDEPLDLPVVSLETIVAEKLQEIVARGTPKARLKDFYDVWLLSNADPLVDLEPAIREVFEQRGTEFPSSVPPALDQGFASSAHATEHWTLFLERGRPLERLPFPDVVAMIHDRVMPVFEELAGGLKGP